MACLREACHFREMTGGYLTHEIKVELEAFHDIKVIYSSNRGWIEGDWSKHPRANAKMADVESLFDFVHMEIVAYFLNKPGKNIDHDVIQNLERLGFSVGQRLVERFTKDSPRFKDELEIMKYICKDFWTSVYKKQIDNLRTNHQGTYVLQDNNFQLLTQMSDGKQYTEDAPKFLAFPSGLIRGALSNFGLTCSVSADVLSMPKCKFQIVIPNS